VRPLLRDALETTLAPTVGGTREESPETHAEVSRAELLLVGDPCAGILGVADSQAADLIVMSARDAVHDKRGALGSTTAQVVVRAGCPVLTVPAA